MTLESRRILSAETIDVPAPVESPPLVLSTAAPVAADPHPAPAPGRPAPVVVVPPPAPTASPTPAPIDYAALIQDAAKRYQVDAELLKCVLEVESGFNSGAVSPKGAMGVAQLMPETARDLGVRNPFDPVQAVDGAARHLHDLLARSGGRFVPALAAYNAGEGTVRRYGGLPPYHETIAYIERILTLYGSR